MKRALHRARAAYAGSPCLQRHVWRWGILIVLLLGLAAAGGWR